MSGLRAAARCAVLAAWTTAVAARLLAAEMAAAARGARRAGARQRILRSWARVAARTIGLRISIAGPAPAGPVLLVANHLSYLDVVVLASLVEANFVAKADVAAWPVVGSLSQWVDTVFIDRGRKRDLVRVLEVLERRLLAGASVIVFPEGTTSAGSEVLPFKSSLFELAVRTGRPTHTASLTYATPDGAPHPSHAVCWWGDMTFGRHLLDLLRLPRIEARVEFTPAPLFDRDRKNLARSAHRAVRGSFQPVSRGEIPCLAPAA